MARPCCNSKFIATPAELTVTKEPLYEHLVIWAEESGATNANSAEWSFGNGATGFMGLTWDNDDQWEAVAMSFHADTYAATATIQVDLMNFGNTPSSAAANTLASIELTSATDGGGQTNNAKKWTDFAAPVPIPANAVLGFITRAETGNISDARVLVKLRRQIGEYVSDVSIA